jgi:hypothetical protein
MVTVTRRRAYPTDLTDAQWALVEPLLGGPAWTAVPTHLPRPTHTSDGISMSCEDAYLLTMAESSIAAP